MDAEKRQPGDVVRTFDEGEFSLVAEAKALKRLNELNSRLWRTAKLEDGLIEILWATIELLQAEKGMVQIVDNGSGELRLSASAGFDETYLQGFRVVTPNDGALCSKALRTRTRVVIEDFATAPETAHLAELAKANNSRAAQSTPLLDKHGEPLGVITTNFLRPRRLSEQELEQLDLYARQAADFIERCRLENAVQAASERQKALLTSVGGVSVDITERRRGDEALREGEERYRILLEALADGVFVAQDHRFVFANAALPEMLGYDSSRFESDVPFDFVIAPEDLEVWTQRFNARVGAGPEPVKHYSVRLLRKNGERLDAELSARRTVYLGRPAVIGVLRDVTERKKAERVLREADRRKDEFMAMLAHELRNPLAPIRNMAAVLGRLPLDNPIVKAASATIERQVAQMQRITDELLDLSRIERGKLQLRTEACDLTALVREAAEDMRGSIEERRLRLVLQLPDDPLPLQGDSQRLSQALQNLLHNAQKFTPACGAVKVMLSEGDGWATLAVQDTGVGISEDLLPHIFEAFRQGPQTIERSHGGLGLGLALVKGIARLHGGDVSAVNLEGQGASFTLRLPLDRANGVSPPKPAPQARSARRLLIVEDDALVGESTRLLLEMMGHDPRVAADGEEALQMARDFKPDYVLCDIGLPGVMDGYAVAKAIRQDVGPKGAFLVALSGYSHKQARDEARAAGFDRYLVKPLSPDALESLLAEEG
ncbi:MAG: ATP-binding protein [Methylocystis sp.]